MTGRKRITQSEFINRARTKHGNRFDYSNTVYTTNANDITVTCKIHGNFIVNANAHCRLKHGGCKNCATNTEVGETDIQRFIRRSKLIFGERFNYPTEFSKRMELICKKHGKFSVEEQSHFKLKNGGCIKCHTGIDSIQERFIHKAIEEHGNTFSYENVHYVDSSTDVMITCRIHGDFPQRPDVHLRGFGCPKCSNKHQYTSSEFISEISKIHPEYDYSETIYKSSHNSVNVKCPTHGLFTTKAYYLLQGSGCPKCVSSVSLAETEVFNHTKTFSTSVKQSVRMIGKHGRSELDIYDERYKIAIEYNGVYWHSSGDTSTDNEFMRKHVDKTNECEKLGIRLYHVFEDEWLDDKKREIWKSVIENAFGKSARLYARKCVIKEVDSSTASDFCDKNHLQGGSAIGSIRYGLFHNDELVSLMTFGKARYSDANYELIRFCNKLHTSVVGAGSRLLNHFRKNHFGSIISYANRRWSDGNFYRKLGFKELHISRPCYFYVKNGKTTHRSGFMKHMLKDKLETFDENLTEHENMYNNGYRRIWDSGNYVFKMEA
ncbi:hypothetical protein Ah1_00330 [Aeromonas phage Ah1]|uniref:Hef-like homing endonuclease n=1 Tax=Aeromonas phage Ah1 TaxID=2053701 RepID=A0A2H4YF89_9CAUD|nr:homing endonuclease [Aeromonas phage Ah1]AUE22848.1 hypothetical protein Ah1_00330 [Aeromonas phage Ah1]